MESLTRRRHTEQRSPSVTTVALYSYSSFVSPWKSLLTENPNCSTLIVVVAAIIAALVWEPVLTLSQIVVYAKGVVPLKSSGSQTVLPLGRKTSLKSTNWWIYSSLSKSHGIMLAASSMRSEGGVLRNSSTSLIPFASNIWGLPPWVSLCLHHCLSVVGVWCTYSGILLFCCQHELHRRKGTYISKAEQKRFPEKCQEPLERAEKAVCRLVLCWFEWEEVGKWNHIGIISPFGAPTWCKSHFCFPSSDFWGNEEPYVSWA